MQETDAGGDLIWSVEDGIARLAFNRPAQRNALTLAMYEGLRARCAGIEAGGPVRVLILTGSGGSFAAGTDMAEFRAFARPEDALAYERRMEAVISAVETCAVPTVAAIDGACTGGGAAIAAACDLRVASPRLKFGFPIARTLGNCLSTANLARLSRLMGPARVREMLLTARLYDAAEAQAMGLVLTIAEDPLAEAGALAARMAGFAPLTLAATREALGRLAAATGPVDDRDLILKCYMSADFREGMEAFLAKRRPVWQGR